MTEEENTEEIELTPYQDNIWWELLEQTKGLDYHNATPRGWHWFWGLDYLYNKMQDILLFPPEKMKNAAFFDVKTIQEKLPDGHWLKKLDSTGLKNVYDTEEHRLLVETLKEIFKQGETIVHLIDFSKLRFDNSANFSDLIFPFDVSFEHTEFSNGVFFHDAIFCRQGNFSKTQFSGNSSDPVSITFNNSIFLGKANFSEANFINGVSFNSASFPMIANFQKATFSEMADFFNARFSRVAIFGEAKFADHTSFRTAKFLGYTTFEESTFEIHAPKFYGAELNDEMFWTDIKLPTLEKVDDTETNDDYKKRIKDNENAYENLSTKLGNQKKYRDKYFFFRQELSCQQKLAESPTSGFAFRIYGLLSGYGYNIGRAFWWWVGHMVLGVLVIAFISMCGGMRFHESLTCAIPVSIANANPYVFFGFESSSLTACYTKLDEIASISFAAVKAIQTVIGIALLSLVIITLRVRFRLK